MKNPIKDLGVIGKLTVLICALDIFNIRSAQTFNQHWLSILLVEREGAA